MVGIQTSSGHDIEQLRSTANHLRAKARPRCPPKGVRAARRIVGGTPNAFSYHREAPGASTPDRVDTYICHTTKNIAAMVGPTTKPLIPITAIPPSVLTSTT